MRLNRVLQLTAAIGMTVAATIFTISCSDGEDGKNGANCTVSGSEGDWSVTCDGNPVGTLTNGPKGPSGTDGIPGATGPAGVDCELVALTVSSYQIKCGGVVKGSLEGCNTSSLGKEVFVACDGSSTVSLCDGKVFDSSKNYCDASGGTSSTVLLCGPDNVTYSPVKQYCGFVSEAAAIAKEPAVLPLCVASTSLPLSSAPGTGADSKPNEAVLNSSSSKWDLQGGTWKDEYCQVTRTLSSGNISDAKKKAVPMDCDVNKVKINENTWKGEYCGFASADAVTKSVVNNACGDGKGPDRDAFGKEYCQMTRKTDTLTTSVTTFCAVGTSASSVATPINKVESKIDKDVLLTIADWKDEYCGYESEEATTNKVLSVLTGTCDYSSISLGSDGKFTSGTAINYGPNASSAQTWENQYCQVPFALKDSTFRKTVLVKGSSAYCIKDASNAFKTAGDEARVNKDSWQNQYCGYSDKESYDANPKAPSVQIGVCGNGIGPNSSDLGWENGYCQANRKGETKKVGLPVGSASNAAGIANNIYCGVTALPESRNFTGSLNKDVWSDQYCGYATLEDFNKTNTTTGTKVLTLSVLNGTCTTNNGTDWAANTATPALGPNAYTDASGSAVTAWKNQYCQTISKTDAGTKIVGVDPTTTTFDVANVLGIYCLTDTTGWGVNGGKIYATAGLSARINDRTWKSEYCGFESRKDLDPTLDGSIAAPTTGVIFTKLTTMCTNNEKPNAAPITAWTNDYCQGNYADNTTKKVSGVADVTASSNAGKSIYCISTTDIAGKDATVLTASETSKSRLNEGGWKGEFCFDDSRGVCLGGQIAKGTTPTASIPGLVATTGTKSSDADACTTP